MYHYDEIDATLVKERVEQFRSQVARRLAGDLSEQEFTPLRLMNGLYLQLHAYMLRVAVPYGAMSSRQMRKLAHIVRTYDKGYAHFTTRQNIQFNWPALVDVPAILDELASVEMHAIQTSGNCIRNVTSDQYAGAAADEVEDPRPYAEMIRQWSTFHPEFSFLPRKFKIAITGSDQDRAAIRLHDIGLRIHKNQQGETGFEVLVGGGLGRTPYVGQAIREFLPKRHLLSYLEAVLRVYNLLGRRDNKYKARIKILVNTEGVDAFRGMVEEEWVAIKNAGVNLPREEVKRIHDYFAPPAFEALDDNSIAFGDQRAKDKDFDRWVRINTAVHKIPGYAIVNVSLKGIGAIPGDISSEQMDAVAAVAGLYSLDEIRATHEQNLVLPHVKKDDLHRVYVLLKEVGLETANIGLVSDIIACPGLDYCKLANTRSIPIAQRISKRFADRGIQEEIGELKIKISGCINACGHHHAGHIGILGVDKKGEEFYQITLGGSGAEDASIGEIAGRGLSSDAVVGAVEKLVDFYREKRQGNERFLDTYRRLGADPFKEILYDAA
jgi:sulfite reductase (NADPH) hemoprotein beta-component